MSKLTWWEMQYRSILLFNLARNVPDKGGGVYMDLSDKLIANIIRDYDEFKEYIVSTDIRYKRYFKIIEFKNGLIPWESEIGYDRPHTLEETGMEFGVTRERIRQIESKIYSIIKRSSKEYTELPKKLYEDINNES